MILTLGSLVYVLIGVVIPFILHRFGISMPFLTPAGTPVPEVPVTVVPTVSGAPVLPAAPAPSALAGDMQQLLLAFQGIVRREVANRPPVAGSGVAVTQNADGSSTVSAPGVTVATAVPAATPAK